MVRCCTCSSSNGGTCVNCVCASSGTACSGCPNLKAGKCRNPNAPSQGPQAPVLPKKKGRVCGRPAPAATNLPDRPDPLRFGALRLGPPSSPTPLQRALAPSPVPLFRTGPLLLMFLFYSLLPFPPLLPFPSLPLPPLPLPLLLVRLSPSLLHRLAPPLTALLCFP